MKETLPELLDMERLERELPRLTADYATAEPFPRIVLDDVLRPAALAQAHAEFDAIDDSAWTNYLHLNERKYANTDPSTWGSTLAGVAQAFSDPAFLAFLSSLTGFTGLHADPSMDGGGLHRSLAGGFLNVHADFTAHHAQTSWRRRVNLLLYLNPGWQPGWGGELELWSRDMARCERRVAPIDNRVLIFTTDHDSYHGHPEPLRCPDGVARRSMALYYFTEEREVDVRSTNYRARPGDGVRAAGIFLDNQALHAYDVLKRRLRLSDKGASRWLGVASRLRRQPPPD